MCKIEAVLKCFVDVSKYASTFLGTDYTDFTDKFNEYIR